MKGFVENRFGLFLLVLIALGCLYGVAYVTRPAPARPQPPGPRKVAVESVTVACPPAGQKVSVFQQGALVRKAVKGPVSGPGTLEAGYTVRETSGKDRGLAGVRCAEPAATTWLIGPGPATADVVLHLTNADRAPAIADILLYAAEGPVLSDKAAGVVIAPGEHRAVDLKTLAPSSDVLAVGVVTTTGRLAVAARASYGGKGVDWLPSSTPPATSLVVPGVPGGGGRRELLVAAPGEADAVVSIKVVSEDSSYAMKGRETLEVPAGSVAALDVTTGLGGQSAALVLTSDQPVVAGVVATGTGASQDVAFTAGTAPLDLGSVVADNGKGSKLVLTAPGAAGKVRVEVVPGGKPFEVDVAAGRTKNVKLTAKGDFGVVVTPVSGTVYGARVTEERLKSGLLLTVSPLAPGRTWAMLPTLTADPAVVLP
ncbi:DUF5719 family protein [Nonomuraea sp. NPDC050556]|uniref:DUF5719 family protein n=1 Tax=Nonomuraea sp. NPDC050556 TaxID=3364369 RepID=UPI003797C0D0